MKFLGWVLCGLLLYSSSAAAMDNSGKFALKGAGFLPCEVFVTERANKSKVYYMIGGWIEGFISAHNKYAQDTYDVLSFESLELLMLVIQDHCQSHPQDRLYQVVDAIINQLNPERLKTESPRVEIKDGDHKTILYRETIRRMQAKLTELGLYKGPVDGKFTDATRSAIIAFQADLKFDKTGFPDQTTLWRLFRGK